MDIFDENIALEKTGGNRELMLELLAMMVNELPSHLETLRELLTSTDGDALWNAAHKLTGSTAYCGVPALQHAARQFEATIRNKDQNRHELFQAICDEADRLLNYYQLHFSG